MADQPRAGYLPDYEAQLATQQNVRKLQQLLGRLSYKPGWKFSTISHAGWHSALQIRLNTLDSNHCILRVEHHEACEHFRLDGVAPFYPEHGEGADPYRLRRTADA